MNRSFSLKRNKEFQRVYRTGKSQGSKTVVLVHNRDRRGVLRVGFSVSKKVGNAVVRNRVKRRMREAFRLLLPTVARGHNLIFIARESAANENFHSLQKTISYLLRKADLIDKKASASDVGRVPDAISNKIASGAAEPSRNSERIKGETSSSDAGREGS